MELPEPRGEAFSEIAAHKVLYAWEHAEKPVIAIDSGLCIPSLNGFPGPYSKWVLEKIGVEGILRLLEGKDRYAYFENALAYMDANLKEPKVFVSRVEGSIAEKARGSVKPFHWSSYFLIFQPKGHEKTLAEMDEAEYRQWSESVAKTSAITAFGNWLSERLGVGDV